MMAKTQRARHIGKIAIGNAAVRRSRYATQQLGQLASIRCWTRAQFPENAGRRHASPSGSLLAEMHVDVRSATQWGHVAFDFWTLMVDGQCERDPA